MRSRTSADLWLGLAVGLWIITSAIAVLDWHGALSGFAFAIGSLAAAATVVALAVNSRQTGAGVCNVVERAPRDQYYRGYGDASDDVLSGDQNPL